MLLVTVAHFMWFIRLSAPARACPKPLASVIDNIRTDICVTRHAAAGIVYMYNEHRNNQAGPVTGISKRTFLILGGLLFVCNAFGWPTCPNVCANIGRAQELGTSFVVNTELLQGCISTSHPRHANSRTALSAAVDEPVLSN